MRLSVCLTLAILVPGTAMVVLSRETQMPGESAPAESSALDSSTAVTASAAEPSSQRPLRVRFDALDLSKLMGINEIPSDIAERMPSEISALEGRRVIIRGYMKPAYIPQGLTKFMLVRDTGMCCYGDIAKMYHAIDVRLRDGTTTDYIEMRPFDVVGRFRIEVLRIGDVTHGLYFLDEAEVISR